LIDVIIVAHSKSCAKPATLPHRVRCVRSNWFSIQKSVAIPNPLSLRDIFLFSFRLFHADCFIRNMVHEFAAFKRKGFEKMNLKFRRCLAASIRIE